MTIVTVKQAVKDFAGTLRHVTAGHEAVVLKSGRHAVAVMLPPAMLDALEDMRDIQEADRIMKAIENGREKLIPWEDVEANPTFATQA
jgi:PHD/YefM family antitoxin component YafN of YafNO toxin-antitoxin module